MSDHYIGDESGTDYCTIRFVEVASCAVYSGNWHLRRLVKVCSGSQLGGTCLIYDKCRSANICALGHIEPQHCFYDIAVQRDPLCFSGFGDYIVSQCRTEFHPGHNLHRRVLPRKIAVARMPLDQKYGPYRVTTFSDEPDLTSIHGLYQHQRDGAAPNPARLLLQLLHAETP